MASRPPEHRPPDQRISDDTARSRWMIITMQRVLGAGMILLGMLVIEGAVAMPRVAGYVFIGVGLIDVFLVPRILARKWRTPTE